MDVWWFRLPRHDDDPAGLMGRISTGRMMVMIDRGDYWQCGYLIGKGSDAALRAEGIAQFRRRLTDLVPWVADRVDTLTSFDDVALLDVRLERLRRWYADGLLLIGDAAHAMSPVGGVGINLAVQDAVAAARILAPALQTSGPVPVAVLRKVQLRRWWPTALVQGAQRLAHRQILTPVLAAGTSSGGAAGSSAGGGSAGAATSAPVRGLQQGDTADTDRQQGDTADIAEAPTSALPFAMRLLRRFPVLQGIPARAIAIGPRPEHAPEWARRPEAPVPAP